jgi:hypothetical protein
MQKDFHVEKYLNIIYKQNNQKNNEQIQLYTISRYLQ